MFSPPSYADLAARLGPLGSALVEHDGDGLLVLDAASGVWLHVNERMAQWLAQPAAALVGHANHALFGDAAAAIRAADQSAATQSAAHSSEHKLRLQGEVHEFSVLRQCLPGDGPPLVAAVWRDLAPSRLRESQLHQALQQLEELQLTNEQMRMESQGLSARDNASGLYNREHFEDQLRREVDLSVREHREFALVAIEIDAPTLGNVVPRARVVDALGRLLRSNTRAMDASCRDDESRFAVLLSGVGLATAHSRMEGLRRQCATQIVAHDGRDFGFTVSMGVASFPHTAQSQDGLNAACEAALADARGRGGNRVTLASIRFDAA